MLAWKRRLGPMSAPLIYKQIYQDQPGQEIRAILGDMPHRWGRMDLLSRMALLEIGRILQTAGLLDRETNRISATNTVGLIAGTRWGSLTTDLAFCNTLLQGPELASPTCFSYTLSNIALAEASSHFGITGPVYSIFAADNPMNKAIEEAVRWLSNDLDISAMVAGELDIPPSYVKETPPVARFQILRRK